MHIGHSSDELSKDLLRLFLRYGAIAQKVVVQFIAWNDSAKVPRLVSMYEVPGQYSRTSQTRFSVTMTSYNRAIWGCKNCLWWWISRARLESSFFADLSTT